MAECMEYPVMGEYHENLTLQEAYELYEKIPPEGINGVKGIGFHLEDGSIYDGLFELMSGGTVISHPPENPGFYVPAGKAGAGS